MNLSGTLEQALNDQIRLEFESAYSYLQMAVDFRHKNLEGFAHWMRLQSEEEWAHGMRFAEFVLNRGGSVKLQAIAEPSAKTGSPAEAFEAALAQEQKVSKAVQALYGQALKEADFASLPLLQWFVNEQIEEEATVEGILDRLRMIASDPTGTLIMDGELGKRTVTPSA